MRACGWTVALILLLPAPASAQGLLERIRRGPAPGYRGPIQSLPHVNTDDDQGNGLDDEGLIALIGLSVAAASSPLWLPPLVVDDSYDRTAYFSPYPYARRDSAFLNLPAGGTSPTNEGLTYFDPDYLKPWSLAAQFEDGNDFNGLNRLGGRVAFDTSTRFGVRTNWDWYREGLGDGRTDSTLLDDTELTFRIAQADWLRVYAGVGFQTMQDRWTDRWGFNFTYGADAVPVWPLVLSATVDLGDLGDVFAFRARGTAGLNWRNVELFLGYDYRRIGDVNLQGMLGGLRLWF